MPHRDSVPGYRPALLILYGVCVLTGCGFLLSPTPTLAEALSTTGYRSWSVLFIGGGAIGMLAVSNSNHKPWKSGWKYIEGVGLLAIGGAVLVLAVALVVSNELTRRGVNWGIVGLFSIEVILLVLRALVLRYQIRIRETISKEIHDARQ